MEHITNANIHERSSIFVKLPEDTWIDIIAHYQIKDTLRKTCRYFRDLASSTNEKILKHSALVLSAKALERFVLYQGALGNSTM